MKKRKNFNSKGPAKLRNAVDKSKAMTAVKDARCVLVHEYLLPAVKEEVKRDIDAHLNCMRSLNSDMGIDSTFQDRVEYERRYNWHMSKIKALNEAYYHSIKIQDV